MDLLLLGYYTIFSSHIKKVNSVAGLNNDLPHPPSLPHPLPSYWINGPTNKCEGKWQPKLTTISPCHNIHVYSNLHPLLCTLKINFYNAMNFSYDIFMTF